VAQINALEQQKRNIEIAIAELRQIYSSFYKKLLEQAEGAARAGRAALASRILGENPRREAPPTFRPSTWH
jgi:hypothetical protein